MVVTLTGFMGCGKSSVGRDLASAMGWGFVDLDEEIVRRCGRSVPELFRDGEKCFRDAEYETFVQLLDECPDGKLVVALGGGAFSDERSRKAVLDRTLCVYLRTSKEEIRRRLGDSDSSRPLYKDMDRLFDARLKYYQMATVAVDTDGRTPAQIAELIGGLPELQKV